MKYRASVSDFFKSPKWGANLLLGAVAILIPVVGQMVLTGWHATGLWARGDEEDPALFPPFDFQFFGKYLERGLWPFLVGLASSLLLIPLMLCLLFPLFVFSGMFDSGSARPTGPEFGAMIAGIIIIQIGLMMAFHFAVTPLLLRATITQDFKSAFDFGFARDFLSRTWKETWVSMFFMFGLGLCLMVITVVTCYIGLFFAAPVAAFSWHHLQKQLYQLHLLRGGITVPLSPKLHDLPPPLPPA